LEPKKGGIGSLSLQTDRRIANAGRAGYDQPMDARGEVEVAGAEGQRRRVDWRSAGRGLARAAVDLMLPPQCLSCRAPTAEQGSLCPRCWSSLRLIEKPYCARLGTPFEEEAPEAMLSAEAIAEPPPFDRARAVAVFDDVARRLVHGLKYRDRGEMAPWMGAWMVRAGMEVIAGADLIVPVPLHRTRLWSRRFNQSALLARVIAERPGKPLAAGVLTRTRSTPRQVGLSQKAREDNVRGAFAVPAAARPTIRGKRMVLVDDVYTTGATAKAATRALLKAGAGAVDVLVFARVVCGSN
jgi:ComF family protein